jgi:hypothetical protein
MYVFGNGESRTSINIDKLNGIKIGCNAIYRDYTMDHLVCVDKPILKEAINSQYNLNSKIYTRKNHFSNYQVTKNIRIVPDLPYLGTQRPDDPVHWGSGSYAVLLAAKLATSEVYLLGFDLYSTDNKVNNIYKDTANYALAYKSAVDPRYWIYQIGMVFKCFPNVNFVVRNNNFELPKSWNYTNVTVDKISIL